MSDSPELQELRTSLNALLAQARQIETRLAALEARSEGPVAEASGVEVPIADDFSSVPPHAALTAPPQFMPAAALAPSAVADKREAPSYESKVGLQWVNRIGVLTLVLGIGFFFKWAVDNQWIGPGARVLLGCLAGSAAVMAGEWTWRRQERVFGNGLTAAGIATVYIALYAGYSFYDLLPQVIAFGLLACVTGSAVVMALRYESEAIAALGFFGAYLTPILLGNGDEHSFFLAFYLLLIDGAALILVRRERWRVVEVLSFGATVLIYLLWYLRHTGGPSALSIATPLTFFTLFALASDKRIVRAAIAIALISVSAVAAGGVQLFFGGALLAAAGAMVYARVRRDAVSFAVAFTFFWLGSGSILRGGAALPPFVGLTTGFALFFAFAAIDRSTQGLLILAADGFAYFGVAYLLLANPHHNTLGPLAALLGVVYAVAALRWFRQGSTGSDQAGVAFGVAVTFWALAVPIQFAGFTISIIWSAQAALLAFIGYRRGSNRTLIGASILLAGVAVRLATVDAWTRPDTLFANLRLLSFVCGGVAALCAARWSRRLPSPFALAEYAGGHVALLTGLSLEALAWAARGTPRPDLLSAQTISLTVLFALYALVLVALGIVLSTQLHRAAGLFLTGLVVAKLYLFDIWQLNRAYRILAFVILGALLLSTSFLYSRFRHVLNTLWKRG